MLSMAPFAFVLVLTFLFLDFVCYTSAQSSYSPIVLLSFVTSLVLLVYVIVYVIVMKIYHVLEMCLSVCIIYIYIYIYIYIHTHIYTHIYIQPRLSNPDSQQRVLDTEWS